MIVHLGAFPRMCPIQTEAISLLIKFLDYMGMFEKRVVRTYQAIIPNVPWAYNFGCKLIWNKYIIFLILSCYHRLEIELGIELAFMNHLLCAIHYASYFINPSFNPNSPGKYFIAAFSQMKKPRLRDVKWPVQDLKATTWQYSKAESKSVQIPLALAS